MRFARRARPKAGSTERAGPNTSTHNRQQDSGIMSTIRPIPAIRYATDDNFVDLSSRLSPPYDVLDESDKAALLDRDARNFVAIDLPHTPPKAAGPAEKYAAANKTLRDWLQDGTMVRDAVPQLYVYHQRYTLSGAEHVRRKFFARLRLEPFGTGGVFPHERTFGGPKEDRLALTKATQCNLSPIFGLYEDAENAVSRKLKSALPAAPLARGMLDGVESILWGVSDPTVIDAVAEMMQSKPIYIADGHHRYGTGLLYRDWLTQEQGTLPPEHPANYVLCVCCAMEDPGLLILPTHRVLPEIQVSAEFLAADPEIETLPLKATDPDEAVRMLADLGPQAIAVHASGAGGFTAVRPRSADILDALEPDHSPAWRRLGLAFLHGYVLERLVKPKKAGGSDPAIRYIKAGPDAVDVAAGTGGTAFLMQPTTMEEMRGVCGAGDLMPHKSTYFYPKLASGLVVNPLAD
jgi:uncharacterized protein (DUF1015 family)